MFLDLAFDNVERTESVRTRLKASKMDTFREGVDVLIGMIGDDLLLYWRFWWNRSTPQCFFKRYFACKWCNLKFAWHKKLLKKRKNRVPASFRSMYFSFTDHCVTNCATGRQSL